MSFHAGGSRPTRTASGCSWRGKGFAAGGGGMPRPWRGSRASSEQIAALGAEIWRNFSEFADTKATLRRMPDRDPILLFPLRLETRFKSGDRGQPQLWVRVYPDQCLADTFEASLTEKEVANAQAFWSAVWRAGGVEADEAAAWRELAASHGAGRAGWIVKHYKPLNPADKPREGFAERCAACHCCDRPGTARRGRILDRRMAGRQHGCHHRRAAPGARSRGRRGDSRCHHRKLPPVQSR